MPPTNPNPTTKQAIAMPAIAPFEREWLDDAEPVRVGYGISVDRIGTICWLAPGSK